jgi:8-oxo-dGTP diphosphatase
VDALPVAGQGPLGRVLLNPERPVSVKAVIIRDGRVLLVANHRDEWELPGGRPEPGESLATALVREVAEETALRCQVREELLRWSFEPVPGRTVDVVAFRCALADATEPKVLTSDEHVEHRWVHLDELEGLPLPDGYRRAVRRSGSSPGTGRVSA